MTEETKVCNKCGLLKPLREYHYRKDNEKYRNECILCERKLKKRHYDENSEDIKAYQKKYRTENREKVSNQKKQYRNVKIEDIKKYQKKYYIKNLENIKEVHKKYHNENKDKINQRKKLYAIANKETIKERRKIYRMKNPEKIREYNNNNIQRRISNNLRTRISKAVKGHFVNKSYMTIELLGCSVDECRKWLEGKFLPGMTWDNYGDWHIDHTIPCASFDLTKPEEQLKCFHYTNLQPLWAFDNLSKGDKIQVLTSEGVFFV